MKVKTYYVPEDALGYLTPGKEYEVFEDELWGEASGYITDDNGDRLFIHFPCSSHLYFEPWQIVEDTDMELSITSECDALREELEVLKTVNNWLHNEIRELRKVPAYPEAAVRAVWEHGVDRGLNGPSTNHLVWGSNTEEVSRIFTEALQKGE